MVGVLTDWVVEVVAFPAGAMEMALRKVVGLGIIFQLGAIAA